MTGLAGQVAVVTDSARGIGRAVAVGGAIPQPPTGLAHAPARIPAGAWTS